jgi:hypothetical protein
MKSPKEGAEIREWLDRTRPERDAAIQEWLGKIVLIFDDLPPRATYERRMTYAHAVAETATFLRRLGLDDEGSLFADLAQSLDDLASGRACDLVPQKRRGRPTPPSEYLMPRAAAALAVDLFMEAGLSLDGAAKEICKRHEWLEEVREGWKKDSADLPDAILNWRDGFDTTQVTDISVRTVLAMKEGLVAQIRSRPQAERMALAQKFADHYLVACKPR